MKLPSLSRIMEVIEESSHEGFCLNCGAERDCCEPDACNYECEECGERQVFGAEECLLQNNFFDDQDGPDEERPDGQPHDDDRESDNW